MKIVQIELNEVEYNILKHVAKRKRKTIKALLRETIRKLLENEETVNPNDPLFTEHPVVFEGGKKEAISEKHDEKLYGE